MIQDLIISIYCVHVLLSSFYSLLHSRELLLKSQKKLSELSFEIYGKYQNNLTPFIVYSYTTFTKNNTLRRYFLSYRQLNIGRRTIFRINSTGLAFFFITRENFYLFQIPNIFHFGV